MSTAIAAVAAAAPSDGFLHAGHDAADRLANPLALARQIGGARRPGRPGSANRAVDPGEDEHQASVLELIDTHRAGPARASHEVGRELRELVVVGRKVRQRRGGSPRKVPGGPAVKLAGEQRFGIDFRQRLGASLGQGDAQDQERPFRADSVVERRGGDGAAGVRRRDTPLR